MGQHNDSITEKVSQQVKDAAHESTMDIIAVLKAAGMNVEQKIDFHPGTGEVRMTRRTLRAIELFKAEMHEKGIAIDKIIYKDDLERSGYYITTGRKITRGGVILAEGETIGFVGLQAVAGQVKVATKQVNNSEQGHGETEIEGRSDTAAGVLV